MTSVVGDLSCRRKSSGDPPVVCSARITLMLWMSRLLFGLPGSLVNNEVSMVMGSERS
jgi:hypothetical protein